MRRFAIVVLLVLALVLSLSGETFASSGTISGEYWHVGNFVLNIGESPDLAVAGKVYAVSGGLSLTPNAALDVFFATVADGTLKVIDGGAYSIEGSIVGASFLLATGKLTAYENSRIALSPLVGYYFQRWEAWGPTGPAPTAHFLLLTSGPVFGGEMAFALQDDLSAKLTVVYSTFLNAVASGEDSVELDSSLLGFTAQASYLVTDNISIDGGYRYFTVTYTGPYSDAQDQTLAAGFFLGSSLHF